MQTVSIRTDGRTDRLEKRESPRKPVAVRARLTWRDRSGATRVMHVITRDVSHHGVFIDCPDPTAIPLFRLVRLQIARDARDRFDLPAALHRTEVLTAVYRAETQHSSADSRHGYALRLLVEPEPRKPVASSEVGVARGVCLEFPVRPQPPARLTTG